MLWNLIWNAKSAVGLVRRQARDGLVWGPSSPILAPISTLPCLPARHTAWPGGVLGTDSNGAATGQRHPQVHRRIARSCGLTSCVLLICPWHALSWPDEKQEHEPCPMKPDELICPAIGCLPQYSAYRPSMLRGACCMAISALKELEALSSTPV